MPTYMLLENLNLAINAAQAIGCLIGNITAKASQPLASFGQAESWVASCMPPSDHTYPLSSLPSRLLTTRLCTIHVSPCACRT